MERLELSIFGFGDHYSSQLNYTRIKVSNLYYIIIQITQDVLPHGTLLWHIASGHFDQDAWKHYIIRYLFYNLKDNRQLLLLIFFLYQKIIVCIHI
jgi:hypothetical protein